MNGATTGTEGAIDGVSFENMFVVHARKHMPEIDGLGHVSLPSVYDGLGGDRPLSEATPKNFRKAAIGLRDTVHFSLNHPVGSHDGGNWSDRNIVIVAPLKDAVALNGNPASLTTVDTFWALPPGGRLTLPGAITVRPGSTEELLGAFL